MGIIVFMKRIILTAALSLSLHCGSVAAQTPPPTIPVKALMEHADHQVKAVYPPIAKAAHVTGDVVIGIEVDETGAVAQAVVISGPEMLRSNAVDAARIWTFKPFERDGKPARVRSAIVFKFHNMYKSTSD